MTHAQPCRTIGARQRGSTAREPFVGAGHAISLSRILQKLGACAVPILRDWDLTLSADDVLRAQGGDPASIRARRPQFVEIAEQALAEGVPLLQPAVLYQRLAVKSLIHERILLDGGGVLSGPLVGRHLAASSQVAVVACTVGPELEKRAAAAMASGWAHGLALDGVGSAAAEALAEAACHTLEEQAAQEGLKTTTPINPGLVGWPVPEGQQQIFGLLDTLAIGLTLLPTGLMLPQKSVSLVIGLGANVVSEGVPCDYCGMRERCRYRSS